MISSKNLIRTIRAFYPAALIAVPAAVLLLFGLGQHALWQDEANTAVLASRLLKYGRPLAYDGVNLVTIDHFAAEDEEEDVALRTADAGSAVANYIRRGDYKADTTWKWHPWGQFVVAAVSLKILGHTTLAARLPFALAALATVMLLFGFARRVTGSTACAAIAALLLTFNGYWILHARQCRYYAVSSLFFVLILMAYRRWQSQTKAGAALFIFTAWCWFQVDYGTVIPVCAVLFAAALIGAPDRWLRTAVTGLILVATVAPFAWYYEIAGRHSVQTDEWRELFSDNFDNMNAYVCPAIIMLAAIPLLLRHRNQFAALAWAILAALALWIPTVAPEAFLRYSIMAAPVSALLTAWVLVTALGSRYAWPAAALVILSPLWPGPMLRPELAIAARQIFTHQPDPNTIVADWMRRNAAPTDEILINYEDLPLMFYLPNPIRGGIAAFRAEDDRKSPPRFIVLRRSVSFVHWPVFERELARYRWQAIPLKAPDIIWGNNPDPIAQGEDPARAADLFIARRY